MTRKRTLQALVVLVGALGAAYALIVPVQTQSPGNSQGLQIGLHKGRQVAAGEVLIKFREDARFAQLGLEFDADRDEPIGDGAIRRVHSRSHNTDTLLAMLSRFREVEYAEPNYIVYAVVEPNDPYLGNLWGLLNTGQTIQNVVGIAGADISAAEAWDVNTGSNANVVAVVDTGIDYSHPDLTANVWSAPPGGFTVNIGGVNISCAAGTHGFNAITKTCAPTDDNGHGTHVSGTIGAVGNNGVGVVGVNWTASIMGLKFLNAQGSGTTADAINAIEFAIQAKASVGAGANVRVLSNSWGGGGFSQSLLDEINKANDNDMLFVAAAGNNKSNNDLKAYYPANYAAPNVVAVAATDNRDGLASFSNYGATKVELGAPGVSILSTYPGNRYAWMNGTSMATPHVSGAAALVLAACGSTLTTAEVIGALLNNTDTVTALAGKTLTGGRLNVHKAVTSCGTAPPPPPADFSITASPGSRTIRRGQSTTYTVTITPSGGFSSDVALSVTGQPSGATATLNPGTVLGGSGTSQLRVSTTSTTARGTFTLTITGTGGGKSRATTVTLKVR